MPLQRMINSMNSLTPTASKEDMPLLFHEPHVETGFRRLHQPWTYYLFSLFQRHNECMNAWTHLLAMLFVIARMVQFSGEFDFANDPYMRPMLAGAISMVLMYLCSFSAHCFHNKSELMHYTMFMIDYAGIGLYGLGSAIVHYTYCMDHGMYGGIIHRISVPMAVIIALITCASCSYSKVKYTKPYPFERKLYQLLPVAAIYSWLILPIVYRLYIKMGNWDIGLLHHFYEILWFVSAGFFFGSDIPQRLFPGRFDFLGHSHQIFHVCIMMTTYKQLDGVYEDILMRKDKIYMLPKPSFMNSYGAILTAILGNIVIVYLFYRRAQKRIAEESPEKHVKFY